METEEMPVKTNTYLRRNHEIEAVQKSGWVWMEEEKMSTLWEFSNTKGMREAWMHLVWRCLCLKWLKYFIRTKIIFRLEMQLSINLH